MTRKEIHEAHKRQVARQAYENPTASQKQIADATALSEDQVKHCLDELKQEGHLISGYNVVDLGYLGYELRYRIDIFLMPHKLRGGKGGLPGDEDIGTEKQLARYILKGLPTKPQFSQRILVEDVQILLGHPADLSATVRATDHGALFEFVTSGLRMCKAIYQTTTCLEAWSCRQGDLRPGGARQV